MELLKPWCFKTTCLMSACGPWSPWTHLGRWVSLHWCWKWSIQLPAVSILGGQTNKQLHWFPGDALTTYRDVLIYFFKIMLEAKSPRWGASRISFFWSLSWTCKGLFLSCVLTTLLLCVLPSCLSLCLLGHQPGRTRASSWWPQLKSPSPNTL